MSFSCPRLAGWLRAVLVLVVAVLASDAWANDRTGAAPVQPSQVRASQSTSPVTVEIMVVAATNRHNRVDAGLESVMRQLRFTRYKGFELLDTHDTRLARGQSSTFDLPGDRKVEVELLGRDDRQARVRVQLHSQQGKILDTTVNIHRNRSMMIAGPSYQDGSLVMPLTARY